MVGTQGTLDPRGAGGGWVQRSEGQGNPVHPVSLRDLLCLCEWDKSLLWVPTVDINNPFQYS